MTQMTSLIYVLCDFCDETTHMLFTLFLRVLGSLLFVAVKTQ